MISDYNRRSAAKNGKNKRLQRTRYGKPVQSKRSKREQADSAKLFDRLIMPQKLSDQQIGGGTMTITDTIKFDPSSVSPLSENKRMNNRTADKRREYQPKYQPRNQKGEPSVKINFLGGLK